MLLLNICTWDDPRFPLLMATAIMYFLLIISPSMASSFLCITGWMCLLFLFTLITTIVENQFSRKIKKFYSNNVDKSIKLRSILAARGFSYFIITPHTIHQNTIVECLYRYIVKTGMIHLHHISSPSTYWSYALATTIYLINCFPTVLHSRQSPFKVLF